MELWSACIVAFVVVFGLLSFLAVAMAMITALFPGKDEPQVAAAGGDPALVAAIATAVAATIPGARVTRVEEQR